MEVHTFSDIMFGVRKELYEINEANSQLSDQMKNIFRGEGMQFSLYKFAKNIGFTEFGQSGIDTLLRKRPRLLHHLMEQQQQLLDRRIGSTKQYMDLIAKERNGMLDHVQFLHRDRRRLAEEAHTLEGERQQLEGKYTEVTKDIDHLVGQELTLDLENRLHDKKEVEIATKIDLEQTKREEQNNAIQRTSIYNAAATSRVLIEQMDIAYAEMDIMRQTLEAEKAYTRTVTKGQVMLGVIVENLEDVLDNYIQYQRVCNKLMLGLNVGLQSTLNTIVDTASSPFYDVEKITEAGQVSAQCYSALGDFRSQLQVLANTSSQQYSDLTQVVQQLDSTVHKLKPYSLSEDVLVYEQVQ